MKTPSAAAFLLAVILSMSFGGRALARDPKVDEMPAIQEIAYYLNANSAELLALARGQAASDYSVEKLLAPLGLLNEKAAQFYDRVVRNTKSPWRTVSSYQELGEAFVAAQDAFVARPFYRLDPRVFEETAFLMGALLQFYQAPVESVVLIAYPRQVYPWLPTYYSFSTCRFANRRVYPWAGGVIFRPRIK
ncbi:MAG: hypothetical protein U1F66_02570 [bacterium]